MRQGREVSFSLLFITAFLVMVTAGPTCSEEALTNESVISMQRVGLSDAVILAKIRSSQTKFDVSTQALVALKGAGVSDQIIEAMMAHAGPTSVLPPPAPGVPVAPGGPMAPGAPAFARVPGSQRGREVMYHLNGDKYVELAPVVVEVQTNSAFFTYKSEMVLAGRRARYRLNERQPVFLSPYAPTEALLVRFKPGDSHDDRNLKVGSGSAMPFGFSGRHGVRVQDRIDVTSEADPRGLYRISPSSPLAPGEYGFIILGGSVTGMTGKAFDFGVD